MRGLIKTFYAFLLDGLQKDIIWFNLEIGVFLDNESDQNIKYLSFNIPFWKTSLNHEVLVYIF